MSKIKLYADDVLLYNIIHSQEDCHNLQQELNLLEEWVIKWKMSFNLQKFEFLKITNKKYPIFSQYFIQNEIIREATHAKYLGVTIDQNLKWSERVKQITNKANSVHGFLRCNLYSCPMSTKINCYKAPVKPVLDYAATVWSPYSQKDIDMVEQVQRRAARFIFNNYSRLASVSEMLTDLNWHIVEKNKKQ